MPGSRASSFQSQVTQPSAHLIEQHPRRDQRAPKRHGLKVGRPSKAAGLQAQLHSNPRGTRRDAVRKHSKPQPANPVRAAEWKKVARDPPSIIPRTRKESKSPATNPLATRERCVIANTLTKTHSPSQEMSGALHRLPCTKKYPRFLASTSMTSSHAQVQRRLRRIASNPATLSMPATPGAGTACTTNC